MPAQIKPKAFESRQNFLLPKVDLPHVYLHAPNIFECTDSTGGQMCGDQRCPFSGISFGSLEEGVTNQCLEGGSG